MKKDFYLKYSKLDKDSAKKEITKDLIKKSKDLLNEVIELNKKASERIDQTKKIIKKR